MKKIRYRKLKFYYSACPFCGSPEIVNYSDGHGFCYDCEMPW